MAEKNSKLVAMIGVMIFTAIGILVYFFLEKAILDYNATGVLLDIKKALTDNNAGLLQALLWLIVCIIIYIGVGHVYSGDRVGPISFFFLLLWLSAVIGLIIGIILWALIENQSISIDNTYIINAFASNLVVSLAPAFSAALSISNGSR